MLDDGLVSVCDGGVIGVSRRFSFGGMICGRELSLFSMMVGDCADRDLTLCCRKVYKDSRVIRLPVLNPIQI